MKPKCLVTGATGLLGQALLPLLNAYEVFALVRDSSQTVGLPSTCKLIQADLSTPAFCERLPPTIDAVVHLAQSQHHKEFPEKALDIATINAQSTLFLLNYARQAAAKTFINASSGAIYGLQSEPCQENTPLHLLPAEGMYYASKLASELYANSYRKYMHCINLRFFFIYGRAQRASMLMPRLVQSVRNHQAITLQGFEGMKINPIYVSDAAKAVKRSLELQTSLTINVAGPEVLSLREVSEIIGEHLQKKPVFQVSEGAVSHLVADLTLMRKHLGAPQTLFKEGIKDLI